jgi:hypothetical protein
MSEAKGQSMMQVVVTTYFPMFIAALSLCTSIYNGYLNNKFVDLIQNNTARVESLRTCKEVIEAYFQVKFRAGLISASAERANAGNGAGPGPLGVTPTEQLEAANAVSKVAALGTYLANLRDDAARERYTHLTEELEKVVAQAASTPRTNLDKLFETADGLFTTMNDDCVRSAKNARS